MSCAGSPPLWDTRYIWIPRGLEMAVKIFSGNQILFALLLYLSAKRQNAFMLLEIAALCKMNVSSVQS